MPRAQSIHWRSRAQGVFAHPTWVFPTDVWHRIAFSLRERAWRRRIPYTRQYSSLSEEAAKGGRTGTDRLSAPRRGVLRRQDAAPRARRGGRPLRSNGAAPLPGPERSLAADGGGLQATRRQPPPTWWEVGGRTRSDTTHRRGCQWRRKRLLRLHPRPIGGLARDAASTVVGLPCASHRCCSLVRLPHARGSAPSSCSQHPAPPAAEAGQSARVGTRARLCAQQQCREERGCCIPRALGADKIAEARRAGRPPPEAHRGAPLEVGGPSPSPRVPPGTSLTDRRSLLLPRERVAPHEPAARNARRRFIGSAA